MLVDLGYRTQSARPWTKEDLQTVLEHNGKQLHLATGWPHVKLLRDAFGITILWDTACANWVLQTGP